MMVKSVKWEYNFMERFILFPKNEFRYYNDGKNCFKNHHYQQAALLFEKALNLKYLKKECIKYLIDCHIELHHFEEVYKMIENEFVDKNVDEPYLLKKYLYTMVLEEQYVEVNELIKIYKENKVVSSDLKSYLDELEMMIEDKLDEKNSHHDYMMKYFLSDAFEDHIQIILNLKKLNVSKYKIEINQFLENPQIDSFIKFSLLKYLIENDLVEHVNYQNFYCEEFTITKENFVDILNDVKFLKPITIVLNNIDNEYQVAKDFIKNIWLDFCMKHYPDLINDIKLASAVLHVFLLKSLSKDFNINDVCKIYEIESKRLFYYFDM